MGIYALGGGEMAWVKVQIKVKWERKKEKNCIMKLELNPSLTL